MITNRVRGFMLLLMAITFTMSAQAENIRGRNAGTVLSDGSGITFNPEELVVIDSGTIPDFQEGLEIRLDIPNSLRRYQNSFALLIFRDINPVPSESNRSYSGTRIYMRLLPSRESAFVRIPFSENHGIAGDALTDVLPIPVDKGQFPLLVTILPVTKGIPDSVFLEELSISTVSLWKNEGSLTVSITNLSGDTEETVSILVDGNEINMGEAITLSAGIHKVRVTSTHAPTVEKTIAVEPGQEVSLNLLLDYRPPELTVNIPDGASIFLDGESVDVDGKLAIIETDPGDHIITYSLGNLEVNRSFTVRPGSKVKIDLIIDIEIVDVSEGAGSEYGAGDG